jgi:hypothetical protein
VDVWRGQLKTFRYKGSLVVLERDVFDWSHRATLVIPKCAVSQEHLDEGSLVFLNVGFHCCSHWSNWQSCPQFTSVPIMKTTCF